MSELAQLDGLRWMRILYAYPSYFDDQLIQEIARNPKVGKLVQHGGGGGDATARQCSVGTAWVWDQSWGPARQLIQSLAPLAIC